MDWLVALAKQLEAVVFGLFGTKRIYLSIVLCVCVLLCFGTDSNCDFFGLEIGITNRTLEIGP